MPRGFQARCIITGEETDTIMETTRSISDEGLLEAIESIYY